MDNWKKKLRLQRRDSVHDYWENVDLIWFEIRSDSTIDIVYLDFDIGDKNGLMFETKSLEELYQAETGLRVIELD